MTTFDADRSPSSPRAQFELAWRPRMLPVLLSLSIIFFLVGSAVSEFRCFPYSEFLYPSFTAARALHRQFATTASLRDTDLWNVSNSEQRGVVRHQPEKVSHGYTLYTSGHDCAAFLVDMEGHLQHRWHLPFGSAWTDPPHVERPVPEPFI